MKRSTLLLLVAFSLIAVACPMVDPDNPKPTPTPTPTPTNDSTTVSLSITRKFTAAELLGRETASLLTVTGDGTYALAFEGEPFALPLDNLKNYDGGRPFRKYCNFPISYNFKLGAKPPVPTGASYGEFDLSTVMPATVNLGSRSKGKTLYAPALPEGMKYVESITLTENSRVSVTLSLLSSPFTGGTVTPSFSVDMRKFFESSDAEDGFLNFDAPLNKENNWTYTKIFRLTGAVFEPEKYDPSTQTLTIDARIGLSGTVAYNDMKATRSSLAGADDTMLLNVTVVLYDVACETITGKFDYKSKEQTSTLDMHGLTSAVSKAVNASNAAIRLDMTNNMPVPTKSVSSLTTKRARRTLGKVEGIEVEATAASGETEGKGSRTFTSSDAGFSKLLSEAPDELIISASAQTDPETLTTLLLGGSYASTLKPSVEIPLALNKNFSTEVRDTLAAPSQLKAALKKGPAQLSGQVSNGLPMPVTMTVKMIDDVGMAVTAETTLEIPASSTAPIDMSVRNTAGEGIDNLTSAVVSFKVTGTDTARPLKSTDALQAELKVKFQNQ